MTIMMMMMIFHVQCYTARADDDHNEQVKVAKIHDEMTETTNAVQINQHHNIVQGV